jgi:molybdopterin converting factor small subunit
MTQHSVEIRLFGAFRRYEEGSPTLHLHVSPGATVRDVKSELARVLSERHPEFTQRDGAQLVSDSAIASETLILADSDPVLHHSKLAILPPVCGG